MVAVSPALTRRQAEVLSAILEGIRRDGYPPTYRELCGPPRSPDQIPSTNAPAQIVGKLIEAGFLAPRPGDWSSRDFRPLKALDGRVILGFRPVLDESDVVSPARDSDAPFLGHLINSIRDVHCIPTLRELADHFGMSKNGADFHLRRLIREGFLSRPRARSAAITPLRDALGRRIVEFVPVHADAEPIESQPS